MNTKRQALSNEALKEMAPSIFATEPAPDVSRTRYSFVPTIQIVEALRSEGWKPVFASEAKSRTANRIGYGKHMLRFRQDDKLLEVGDVIPEISFFNAHDGSGKAILDAGLFRCWCANQCVVADSNFTSIAVKHSTDNLVDEIVRTAFQLGSDLPQISGSIKEMRAIDLSKTKRQDLAAESLLLKWEEQEDSPITVEQLLLPRREQDQGTDLWSTFNVVQENMLKGGIEGKSATGRRVKTKPISSVVEDLRLNRGLWEIADSYRQKAA